MLSKASYTVDTAPNGLIGVDLAERNRYDAILMDVHMPDMDGTQAAAEIRRREAARKTARVPIIALTADATKEAMKESFKQGMDDYVTKPMSAMMLFAVLSKWIKAPAGERIYNG